MVRGPERHPFQAARITALDCVLPLEPAFDRPPLPVPILDTLFGDTPTQCHLLVDASALPGLRDLIEQSGLAQVSLWSGEAQTSHADVAPYLVTLRADARLTRRLLTLSDRAYDLWGRLRPLLLLSAEPIADLRARMRYVTRIAVPAQAEGISRTGLLRFWETGSFLPLLRHRAQLPGVFAHWQVAFSGTSTIWFTAGTSYIADWPDQGAVAHRHLPPVQASELRFLVLAARYPAHSDALAEAFCIPWFAAQGDEFDSLFAIPNVAHVPLIAACAAPRLRATVLGLLRSGLSPARTGFALSRLCGAGG